MGLIKSRVTRHEATVLQEVIGLIKTAVPWNRLEGMNAKIDYLSISHIPHSRHANRYYNWGQLATEGGVINNIFPQQRGVL